MINIELTGKTAVITGAGQGLGAAIAQTLYGAGANVVINYFKDPQGVNEQRANEVVKKLGSKAVAIEADVRNQASVEAMIAKTIEAFGRLDIVVNNAGIIRDKTIKKMSSEEWQSVLDTNLTGPFNVCKCATEKLAEGGRIVNFASISGVVGFFGQCNYSASKAGVIALTKVLSKELGKRKITVNAIAPGVVLTEMGKTIPEEVRAEMLKSVPLGRFGEPSEIASVVLFLCSDLASYVTGQVIHVNGGWIG
ncbi:MAG: beta-ketoacyl-ACP reductase [Planctomycetes bacterium GWF2_50_10]|nr:MAG: beta-ketoacyl-ACP reductase [Planctomycetes bacterium GWF2_50_10]